MFIKVFFLIKIFFNNRNLEDKLFLSSFLVTKHFTKTYLTFWTECLGLKIRTQKEGDCSLKAVIKHLCYYLFKQKFTHIKNKTKPFFN